MRADICIARLTMTVDPTDGSYMPSKVRVSAGDSFSRLKELRVIAVKFTEPVEDVLLLQDIKEVRKYDWTFFNLRVFNFQRDFITFLVFLCLKF